ncbi:MAG: hypothetical protein WAU58_04925 [Terriglobales bacterium]
MATMHAPAKPAQIRLTRRSPAHWRVTNDNPPINVMGPEMVKQFHEVINALDGAVPGLGSQSVVVDVRISRGITHISRGGPSLCTLGEVLAHIQENRIRFQKGERQ